jgi:hypothetical protein
MGKRQASDSFIKTFLSRLDLFVVSAMPLIKKNFQSLRKVGGARLIDGDRGRFLISLQGQSSTPGSKLAHRGELGKPRKKLALRVNF